MFTIQQVADKTGLSAHTLRYYEKCGLIDTIERDEHGYRSYSPSDMARIQMLCCLRRTGMSIKGMQRYATLLRSGDHTTDERRVLLQKHRREVETQICELTEMLKIIDHKIDLYTPIEHDNN